MEKKEMILFTVNESKYYKNQNVCYICKELLIWQYMIVTLDYCHYSGKYRGAVHTICNLRYKRPKQIPVVFLHLQDIHTYQFCRMIRLIFWNLLCQYHIIVFYL